MNEKAKKVLENIASIPIQDFSEWGNLPRDAFLWNCVTMTGKHGITIGDVLDAREALSE